MMPATLALITFGALGFSVVDALRDEASSQEDQLVKCHAIGNKKAAMSVTFGVPKKKCMTLCGPYREGGATYELEFTNAFTVDFDKKCRCFAGGKERVNFSPFAKDTAMSCANGASSNADKDQAVKAECWRMYKKARGTRFHTMEGADATFATPIYEEPFGHSDFHVDRECSGSPCVGDACHDITLPDVLEDMPEEQKKNLGKAIKQIMDGKKDDVAKAVQELIAILPKDNINALEFANIDADNDGTLSVEELADFYSNFTPEQIGTFLKAVDDDGNNKVDVEEFARFKEEMINFNPDVDLITGEEVEFKTEGDQVVRTHGVWKVAEVVCMKGGKAAPGECEGFADDAIAEFNKHVVLSDLGVHTDMDVGDVTE
jgi:hypothetical protein